MTVREWLIDYANLHRKLMIEHLQMSSHQIDPDVKRDILEKALSAESKFNIYARMLQVLPCAALDMPINGTSSEMIGGNKNA